MRHPVFKYFTNFLHLLPEVEKFFKNYGNEEEMRRIGEDIKQKIKVMLKRDLIPSNSPFSDIETDEEELDVYAEITLLKLTYVYLVIENGLIFIDATSDDWRSEFSERTISKLKPSQIKMPFNIGMIRIKHDEAVDVIFSAAKDGIMLDVIGLPESYAADNLEELVNKHMKTVTFDFNGKTIGEILDESNLTEFQKSDAYQVLSALMYISMARESEEHRKTVVKKKIKGAPIKKKGVPKHTVNYIKVTQKKAPSVNAGGEAAVHRNSTWLVRGHWRNQWYAKEGVHKPKWIDAHWRGKGKDVVEKVYRLSN